MSMSVVVSLLLGVAGCADPSSPGGQAVTRADLDGGPAKAQVVVYYFHRTFRCFSCTRMEHMVRAALQEEFSTELADGTVVWKSVDYQQHETLARQYGVVGPSVVVSPTTGAAETSYEKLNQLWGMVDEHEMFSEELRAAVVKAME